MKNNSRHTTTNTDRSERLTLEQFVGLAGREPSLAGRWIYRLDHTMATDGITYPAFDTNTRSYMFLSLDEAETHMRQNLTKVEDTYCFLITQLPVGEPVDDEGARWLYDAHGRMVDYSVTTNEADPLKSKFYGRPASRVRFKKGDIVEVMARGAVHLAVVAADFLPIEWFWHRYAGLPNSLGYFIDDTDDSYYLLEGPDPALHRHHHALSLMSCSRPLPKDIKTFFVRCIECVDKMKK